MASTLVFHNPVEFCVESLRVLLILYVSKHSFQVVSLLVVNQAVRGVGPSGPAVSSNCPVNRERTGSFMSQLILSGPGTVQPRKP